MIPSNAKVVALAWAVSLPVPSPALPAQETPQPESQDRLVKQFDFDEKKLGNLEMIPMHWVRHEAEGFPRFARGQFDFSVGHRSAPSFYLPLEGRNCAYHYKKSDIAVEANSDYRVVAHISPDRLEQARAYISAYLLDANGRKIPGTEQLSRRIGGDPDDSAWQRVFVRLPGDVDGAYFIGISVWVVQRVVWDDTVRPVRHIEHRDVYGGAWFDDILVYRLPVVQLASDTAANVYDFDQVPVLKLRLGSQLEKDLRTRLLVKNAADEIIREERIDSVATQNLRQITLDNLTPGVYSADLQVQAREGGKTSRHLSFCKLPPAVGPDSRPAHRYGIVLEPPRAPDWTAYGALLHKLKVKNVKIALSYMEAQIGDDPGLDAFIKDLGDAHVDITGTLTASGSATKSAGFSSLIDLLSKPVQTWRPFLGHVVTRYENVFAHWQLGADGSGDIMEDPRLADVLAHTRAEMSNLTTLPVLVAPAAVHRRPLFSPGQVDRLSITIPVDLHAEEIPEHVRSTFEDAGFDHIWALVEVPQAGRYKRLPYLADFAKRVIFAHQSLAEKVYVRQPWHSRSVSGETVTEPNELYILLHTLVKHLDDARYIGNLYLGSGVSCHAFDRDGRCVLVMWDDNADFAGREHLFYLSGADSMTDMWGGRHRLASEGGKHRIVLTPMPVLVHAAESWLVQFRQGLRFEPPLLPSSKAVHEKFVRVENTRGEPISGRIKLDVPPGWQIRPAQFGFALQPGKSLKKPLHIQAAPREPAGEKQIQARVVIDASRLYQFDDRLQLQLDLEDFDVRADLVILGDQLVIRHIVTNRSEDSATFRSFADAPNRKRQYLNIINLQPGQSVVKGHLLKDAGELSGESVRIGLRQVKGPRVHELSITVP